jgi:hypothetical protein
MLDYIKGAKKHSMKELEQITNCSAFDPIRANKDFIEIENILTSGKKNGKMNSGGGERKKIKIYHITRNLSLLVFISICAACDCGGMEFFMELEFWDCNLTYGPQTATANFKCFGDLSSLLAEMERSGVSGGLVIKTVNEAVLANSSLAGDIKDNKNLKGIWQILPSCTAEIPAPDILPQIMKENNIGAITVNPNIHRYLPRKNVIGDYMQMAKNRKIPVMLNTSRGLTLEQADDIMRDFFDLTAILTFDNCWPSDRYLRPFLDTYPNLVLDMTYMLTDCGLADMLKKYPAEKILFGSGFPVSYMGAHMMVIKHAEIPEEDKRKIAGGNLKKLLEGACYD